MKPRTSSQLEADRRSVCARAVRGCYFERLGVRLIETRSDIDAALARALALNVDRATEQLLREAHATLIDPTARSIYLLVRERLVAHGLLSPLRMPNPFERACYACWYICRYLSARIRGKQASKRKVPGVEESVPNPLKTAWAKSHQRPLR